MSGAEPKRCAWAGSDPLYQAYHDGEWGVPVHDDRLLFEFLILEGAQAGLSWITILKKRDRYREIFANFDPAKVARFTPARVEKLLADPGIVRNRLKVEGAVKNARAFLAAAAALAACLFAGCSDSDDEAFPQPTTVRSRWTGPATSGWRSLAPSMPRMPRGSSIAISSSRT